MPRKLDGLKIGKEIAKSRSGCCLSTRYVNCTYKMLWECKEKHQWYTTLSKIRNCNHWCSKCAHKVRSENRKLQNGLEVAREVALRHNGKCLSEKYENIMAKMLWQCEYNHLWETNLNNTKNSNSWCPECAKIKRKNTVFKKYGVEFLLQNQEIALNIAKKLNNSYTLYHWKTGEELICVASYEKAVVEYFNKNKINFRWQPKTFKMPSGKTYRPDCYLFSARKWIEIKGYFRKDAEEKWNWFQTIKPNSELWNKQKLKEMGIL